MPTKGMRNNTSRGHLPLHHHLQGFQVFEVRNVEMKRRVNAFLQNVVTPKFPPNARLVLAASPHMARRGLSSVLWAITDTSVSCRSAHDFENRA